MNQFYILEYILCILKAKPMIKKYLLSVLLSVYSNKS